jgi:hypothetical protein
MGNSFFVDYPIIKKASLERSIQRHNESNDSQSQSNALLFNTKPHMSLRSKQNTIKRKQRLKK